MLFYAVLPRKTRLTFTINLYYGVVTGILGFGFGWFLS